jgi:deoxyribose-phosphate aldolase
MTMNDHSLRETAAVALSLLDLTNLKDDCNDTQIVALCARSQSPFGHSAAICIWPRFVARARSILGTDHAIKIATVVNFPAGDMEVADVAAETREAIADGADEIDLVIPYRKMLAGDEQAVTDMVAAIRAECGSPVLLKVILETGELKEAALIRRAAELAIDAGADFIKTSTGKVAVNATLETADIMLRTIRDSGRKVGFKAAGGIGSVAEAALYLRLAETVMAEDWAMPSTFRFGASGLLDDILAVLSGGLPITLAAGY